MSLEPVSLILAEAIVRNVPSLLVNIAKSVNLPLKKPPAETAKIPGELEATIRLATETVQPENSQTLLTGWIENTRRELSQERALIRNQAKIAFTVAIAALIIGILIIFSGIILVFTVNLSVGAVTSGSGIASNIISLLAFNFNKQANDRLEKTAKEMRTLDNSHIAMIYISQIADEGMRNTSIQGLAQRISSQE